MLVGLLGFAFALSLPFLFDSAAERSAKAVEDAEARIAAGDDATAMPLLATAVKLDPKNREAKRALAGVLMRKGSTVAAKTAFEDLVVSDPKDLDALIALAVIAFGEYDFPTAKTNADAALAIAPENADAQALAVALRIEDAIAAKDQAALAMVSAEAQDLLRAKPDSRMALRAAIRAAMSGPDPTSALPLLDRAAELSPTDYDFAMLRLGTLNNARERDGALAQMQQMFQAFPEQPDIGDWLFATLDGRNDYAAARDVLFEAARRADFARAQTDVLLDYTRQKGPEGDARATLDRIVAAAADPATAARFALTAAALDSSEGRPDAALAGLQALLDRKPDPEIAAEARTQMARLYLEQGDTAKAEDMIGSILASAPGTVAALKLQARIQIDAGNPAQAITALQTALDQSPHDSQVMLLLGEAYEKSNALPLAGERFALAVEYSNNGVEESMMDAAFLARSGRPDRALEVLTQAVEANPGSVPLLAAAARAYAGQLDWARAQTTIDRLAAIGSPEAVAAADQTRRDIALTQETLATTHMVIDRILAAGPGKTADAARAVERMIDQRKPGSALTYLLDPERGSAPATLTLRAMAFALNGQAAEAETQLRSILQSNPSDDLAFLALYRLLLQSDDAQAASALLNQALAQPEPPMAALLQAADLKADAGDTAGAIALTETAWKRDPDNAATAALLARRIVLDPQSDPAALRHARDVAAPLRSLDRPLVLDTLGWVEVRLGTPAAGLTDLQSAGRLLPDDPTIRFHRAMALYALDRRFEARDALQSYLDLDADKPAADVDAARAALEKLSTGE